MKYLTPIWLILICFLLVGKGKSVYAQLSESGVPASIELSLPLPANIHYLRADTFQTPQVSSDLKVLPFAHAFQPEIEFLQEAEQTMLEEDFIFRLMIISPGAKSIYLEISELYPFEGEQLFVFDPAGKNIRGAFTNRQQTPNGLLAISPIAGDTLIIELKSKTASPANFRIYRVYHDYLGITSELSKDGTYGQSGDCEIDINCYEGLDWQREKRAVCRIITNGQLCTGTLVNNTRQDGRPFILTANHCISTEDFANSSIFYFNYESPSCYGPDGSTEQSISWSHLHATTYHLDFALLEMSMAPPPSFQPYYAGIATSSEPAVSTTSIHHPQGDVKKISKEYEPLVSANYGSGYDANSHWKISKWDVGTTEGGSSGSPLFNSNHLIIGTLTGGEASCSYLLNDYFSKIHLAWNEYPGINQQLQYWLDPDSLNPENLSPYEPYALHTAPTAQLSSETIVLLAGQEFDFADLSTGNPESWFWEFEGGNPATSSERHPKHILYAGIGNFDVKLTVSNAYGSSSKVFENMIQVKEACNLLSSPLLTAFGTETATMGSYGDGYWTGTNGEGITDFAEKQHLVYGDYWIFQLMLVPGKVVNTNSSSFIRLKIWEGGSFPQTLLYSSNIPLSEFTENQAFYHNTTTPIFTHGNHFIGYSIHLADGDTFAIRHSAMNHPGNDSNPTPNYVMLKNLIAWFPMNAADIQEPISLDIHALICDNVNEVSHPDLSEMMNLYPNPVEDQLNLEINSNQQIRDIRILSLNGTLVLERTGAYTSSACLETKMLSPGLYFIQITTNTDVKTLKFIKL